MKKIFSTVKAMSTTLVSKSFDSGMMQTMLEELLQRYGSDSLSYLSLDGIKQYFVEKNNEGFIAYVVIQNTAVCIGNPVCAISNSLEVVNQFILFCKEHKYKICFCSINEEFAKLLQNNEFVISKYGEEALLDLHTYSLTGSKKEKLRQKIRRAERFGIRTVEYIPGLRRDQKLEEKIQDLSKEWYAQKNCQLTFTLGDLNFDNPLGRRFFVALDKKEEVVAILMFSPFDYQNGYFLDVMRRRSESVPGVMEKAIIDAAMKIRNEGGSWISLGLAPLAGIDRFNLNATHLEKLFYYVYYNGNLIFSFQSLYQYKKKFDPSCWNSRYVAHERKLSTIKVAYVMAKARNINGVSKLFYKSLQRNLRNIMKRVLS